MTERVWLDLGDGRSVYRRVRPEADSRSHLSCPMIVRDFDKPVQSMANGRWYTSKRDLEATFRSSGNPQGKDYDCVGDTPLPTFMRPKKDRKAQREAIERAINDVASGNAPRVLTTNDRPI